MSLKQTQQPKNDASSCQDSKADRKTPNSDSDGVVSVDVKRLGRPEHQHGEEIGAGDEGDDEG